MLIHYSFQNIPMSNKFYYDQKTILYYDLKPSFWLKETSLQQAVGLTNKQDSNKAKVPPPLLKNTPLSKYDRTTSLRSVVTE
jgi:hypothetical protein